MNELMLHGWGVDAVWIVLPLGAFAGVITTVAGLGGGLVLTLAMAALWGPHLAFAIAAPALLLGNAHRLFLFRADVDRGAAMQLAVPALVGAALGGLVTAALPEEVLRWLLLGVTALAIVRQRGLVRMPTGRVWLVAGGALVGFITSTTGGGGLLLAPLMLAAGLRGATFVATGAVVGTSIHIARLASYGGTGMLSSAELPVAIVLGVAILAGNMLGKRLRPRLGDKICERLTWVTLLGGVTLAVLGLGRAP